MLSRSFPVSSQPSSCWDFFQGCALSVSSLVWGFLALVLRFHILWAYVLYTDLCFGCYSTNSHLSASLLNLHERVPSKKPINTVSL